MPGKKITIIGGGSSTFVPQLMRLFIGSQVLKGSTITLMDIDAHRLEVMDSLARQLIQKEGADLKIESTLNQRESLVGADFVITSISVGGFDAWETDIEVPARYGIYMAIGDSIGPGGIMRSFRHIPVLVEVCKDLEEVSPNAWILNYSNPATAIAMAMQRHSRIKSLSLCTCSSIPRTGHGLIHLADVEASDFALPAPAGGLNHCAAILSLHFKDGRDAFPLLREKVANPVVKWVLDTYGILPYCWSHWTEFFPFLCRLEEPYQGRLQGLKMKYNLTVHDMEHERQRVRRWEEVVERWARREGGEEVSLDVLPSAEAIEVVEIMEALIENRNETHVINMINRGAIGNLPDDAIVEVSAQVNAYGVHPIHVGELPDPIATTLTGHAAVQALTVEAAMSGDRRLALQTFLQDPAVAAVLAPEEAARLLDDLLRAHARHLPRFN